MYFDIINDLNLLIMLNENENENENHNKINYPILLFIKDNINILHLINLFNKYNIIVSYKNYDDLINNITNNITNNNRLSTIINPDILCFIHNNIVHIFENIYNPTYSKIINTYNTKYIHISTDCEYIAYTQKLLICLLIYCNKDSSNIIANINNFSRYLLKICYLNGIVSGANYYLLTNNIVYLPKYLENTNEIKNLIYKISFNNYKIVCSNINNVSFDIIDCIKYIYLPFINNKYYINIDNLIDIINYVYNVGKLLNIMEIVFLLHIVKLIKQNLIQDKINNLLNNINIINNISINNITINMEIIMYIFKNNYIDIIKLIIENNIIIDYNYKDIKNNTILHYACINKNYEIIKHIYKLSNIYALNNNNVAPIDFTKYDDIIKKIFGIDTVCKYNNICMKKIDHPIMFILS